MEISGAARGVSRSEGEKSVRPDRSGGTRTLPIAHRRDRRLVPMKVRPNIGPSLAAGLAEEARLEVGQPHVVSPFVRADRNRVAAFVIRAIDQDATHAGLAHFAEGDFLRAG
jgi:hypothetical protein